jgi:hypothetical protein
LWLTGQLTPKLTPCSTGGAFAAALHQLGFSQTR